MGSWCFSQVVQSCLQLLSEINLKIRKHYVRVSSMNAVLKIPLVPLLYWNISQIFQFASRRHRPASSPWVPVQRCKCWSCNFMVWEFELLLLKVHSLLQRQHDTVITCVHGFAWCNQCIGCSVLFILRQYPKSIPRSIPPSQIFRIGPIQFDSSFCPSVSQ